MISKNHSNNLFYNIKRYKLYRTKEATVVQKIQYYCNQGSQTNLKKKAFIPKINLNYDRRLTLNKISKELKNGLNYFSSKSFTTKINSDSSKNKNTNTQEANTNDKKIDNDNNNNNSNVNTDNNTNNNSNTNANPNSNSTNNNFYLDEYFFSAINSILTELNKDLKSKDLENFLIENKSFEKLYKLFMEVLKKSEDNLFPFLTLIFNIKKEKQTTLTNSPNKISIILSDNYLNLKRKYMCLAILNQIYSKMNLKNEAGKNAGSESSIKDRIFGGGLYESIKSQFQSGNPKEFKGAVIITKNHTDAIEYYETLRKFDQEGKILIKKFGSVHLGIKGLNLKKERNFVAEFLNTEKEDIKNESWSQMKFKAMQKYFPKNGEFNILIFPQDYINLFIKKEGFSTYSESEVEYYQKIIDFFETIDPEILLVDDFDLFSTPNLLHLKKFIGNPDVKNFFVNDKLDSQGKNHIFLSSSIKMKNYFLHVEKEKNFDQKELNLPPSLKNNSNNAPTNPVIVEKIIKNFINKNIVELLDELYLNKSIAYNAMLKQSDASGEAKIGIADLNLKFFIAKNFLKEKNMAGKFYIELEKLRDNRQDERLNKILRSLKNAYFSDTDEILYNSKNKKGVVPNLNKKQENYAIVAKENDYFLLEKNLQVINADYKRIGKDTSVCEIIDIFSKSSKKKGLIYIIDEDSLKYIDFKFDRFFLYETPDELASYFKIFSLLKEKGKIYIVSPSNEFKSKIEFFEDLTKLSL